MRAICLALPILSFPRRSSPFLWMAVSGTGVHDVIVGRIPDKAIGMQRLGRMWREIAELIAVCVAQVGSCGECGNMTFASLARLYQLSKAFSNLLMCEDGKTHVQCRFE